MTETACFEKLTAVFSDDVRKALRMLTDTAKGFLPPITVRGKDLQISVLDSRVISVDLILKAYDGVFPQSNPEETMYYRVVELSLSIEEASGRYCLSGEAETLDGAETEPFVVTFSDAMCETHVFSVAGLLPNPTNPWEIFFYSFLYFKTKRNASDFAMNEKERALYPIFSEIACLFGEAPDQRATFPCLRTCAERYGCQKILRRIDSLEKKKRLSTVSRMTLLNELSSAVCEPMWRELYEALQESQSGYGQRDDVSEALSSDAVSVLHQAIAERMRENGYSGCYPDFEKSIAIRAPRRGFSDGQVYVIAFQKNVRCRVHCEEYYIGDGDFTVRFFCGTAILGQGERADDIVSCLFRKNGKRFCDSVDYFCHLNASKDDLMFPLTIEETVDCAVKHAELLPLTKRERKAVHSVRGGAFLPMFLLWLAVGLIFFGGGMALLLLIHDLCVGSMSSPANYVAVWLGCGGVWGAAMGFLMGLIGTFHRR